MEFLCREEGLQHCNEHDGGRQRYRDDYPSLAQLAPHVIRGQEWRVIVAKFLEFYSRFTRDWEKFTLEMGFHFPQRQSVGEARAFGRR